MEKSFKEYSETMRFGHQLQHVSIPVGALIGYTFFVWPAVLTPQEKGRARYLVTFSFLIKWIDSLERFMTLDDMANLSALAKIPGFLPRFVIWIASGIPILASFVTKVGHVLGVIAGCFEVFLLAWQQMEVHAELHEYSIYPALEEWLNTIGNIVHYSAGVTKQAAVAKVALVLCNAGIAMSVARSIAEVTGNTTRLYSGVSVGP